MLEMTHTRRATATLKFNGVDASAHLESYLSSVQYTDPAQGDSDALSVHLQNIDGAWLSANYPHLGDTVSGTLSLLNWNAEGDNTDFPLGTMILDTVEFSGGPRTATLGALSVPADTSFRTRERSKTWEAVTLQTIASELAGRYGLALQYDAPAVDITSIEQSNETDCSFLYKTVEDYGLSMKVYNKRLVIYDMGRLEAKSSGIVLTPESFVGDEWTFKNTLMGVYTGARISYKKGDDSEEISLYVGLVAEDAPDARTLFINETLGSEGEARQKARAKVNRSNTEMETLTASVWPDTGIVSGITVEVQDLWQASGRYFVDKMTFEEGDSGTKQTVEMHRCQTRL